MSRKILRIFDGVDRVGKTTCIEKLKLAYEAKGLKVKLIHNKDENLNELVSNDDFKRLNALISDYNEKASVSLLNYAYFFQILFEDYDVILVDRLFMTFKVYAEVNRPGSIERVFTKQENFYEYVKLFIKMLNNMHDDVDVAQYVFVKWEGSDFEDDELNERFKQNANTLRKVNERYIKEFASMHRSSVIFNAKADEAGYFDTFEIFKKYQLEKNSIVIN